MLATRYLILLLCWPVVSATALDFDRQVYPILQRHCLECHGPQQAKGKLAFHTAAARDHAAVSPGRAESSELLRRIGLPGHDSEAMPRRGDRLSPAQVAVLRQWIDEGAAMPASFGKGLHWAYVAPQRPALPAVKQANWCRTEMDRFILAKLEAEGLAPAGEAAPASLLRRLSLDLTGLPPKPEAVIAFESAKDPGAAYAKAIEDLLASPEFGPRWARPWLDLARYADSHGFQRDDLRSIWGYRDWVISALNRNLPFDQFTIEQIAGDLLPDATTDQRIATGFHRCTPTNVEAGTDPEESRINQVIDRVNTTGAVWLGSTLECAQCHDHKYDAFSQRDYYQLLAYFNNTVKEAERTNPSVPSSIQFRGNALPLPQPEIEAQRAPLQAQIAALTKRIEAETGKPGESALTVLSKGDLTSESMTSYEHQADGSLLLTGEVPDEDLYTYTVDLPAGPVVGLVIEALVDDSLPGRGPGRGNRPNFVLQSLLANVVGADKKGQSLKFASAQASYSQKGYAVDSLLKEGGPGWAVTPKLGQSHWAAFMLAEPKVIAPGSRLRLLLEQRFGEGRVIGRLRVSIITGKTEDALAKLTSEPIESPQVTKLRRQQALLTKKLATLKPNQTEVMQELDQPRMTTLFKRGDYLQPSDRVSAATPAIFPHQAKGPANRLTLARWLVSRSNPLTARVTVNRWWAEIFGQGIVGTPEDFGVKGAAPTHPELLDWLAVEFMDSGWDMKALLRHIVSSATYRQNSTRTDAAATLYASGPRFRMDAEMIRDSALQIAGLLNVKQGGESIRPPQPDGLWRKVGGQQYNYEVSPGDDSLRRGIYVVMKRGSPYPSFMNFDASARMSCVVRRSRSNTPLQALTLLNDPVYVQATKALARRMIGEPPGADRASRITRGFRLALSRAPSSAELAVLQSLWDEQYGAAPADQAIAAPEETSGLSPAEFHAWYAVASTLLNLDECITKE
jgi:Protein of unknown function (DUF1553)/Protein of unknown function (DUF1549)/Planctomycete cytochrome C